MQYDQARPVKGNYRVRYLHETLFVVRRVHSPPGYTRRKPYNGPGNGTCYRSPPADRIHGTAGRQHPLGHASARIAARLGQSPQKDAGQRKFWSNQALAVFLWALQRDVCFRHEAAGKGVHFLQPLYLPPLSRGVSRTVGDT